MASNKTVRRGFAARSESSARCSARLSSAAPARLARPPRPARPARPARSSANPPADDDEEEEEEEDDLANYHLAQAMPPLTGKPSATITALQQQPAVRRPVQRPNQGALNLSRMGNREAYLAQAVGALAAQPCALCICVVVSGWQVDTDSKDSDGRTPLSLAAAN